VNQRNGKSVTECWLCHKVGHTKVNCPTKKIVECWTCHKKGHISRVCPEKKPIKCFGCGKVGHTRRFCQEIKCNRCGNGGHRADECYTNLKMQRNTRNFQRNQGNHYNRVHAITDEDVTTDDGNEEVYESDFRKQYPNDQAPPVEELVGAIHC